jgi:nitrogen regulatory protein P-II 1
MSRAKLLICIIEKDEKLDEVLEAFVEEGITGASVLDVRGMFEYLADEVPLFAGFRGLIDNPNPTNKMILSVRKDEKDLQHAMDVIESVCGSFAKPSSGIMFSLDVSSVRGLKY